MFLIISVQISFCFNCTCPSLHLSKITSLLKCLDIDQFIFYMPTKETVKTKHHCLPTLYLKYFAILAEYGTTFLSGGRMTRCQLATVILHLHPALSMG